ncbi:SLBB domain-containing protein [Chitinophaga caseinilytica]|uniref:SLBB domain-containing protein n=1 Tax=Chitinophaga caseinilytica TaxID=2267521 RepID=UPI003C2B036B
MIQAFLLAGLALTATAQNVTPSQIQQVKVDNLTDEEIRQIVDEMKRNNVMLDQIDSYAQQKGIPSQEVAKLKDRIRTLNLEKELTGLNKPPVQQQINADRSINDGTSVSARDIQPMTEAELKRSKIFGSELFNNKNLTFEPNLRMATPPNYRLAASDQLVIDVYGYSEVQHKLEVSPEGYIRIPYLGPVYVNGLTIEEAKKRITNQLSTIYSGIKSGNTFVQVSLGNIRSIKVLIIGEVVRPGSYTLPSLATVANALYLSGGPNENGSFRDIQVIRNGQPVANFDLYDFLNKGDLTNNIVVQDQDIVKVNPYKIRAELTGEVKRPAIFEIREGETLQDLLNYAGGYTDISYKDVIRAYRINNKERELVNIRADEVAGFMPRSGDKFFIDAILNRFNNRVRISGSVFHPGEYALEPNMTVADLIRKASGVKEDAVPTKAIIFRLKEDYTPVGMSFNLEDVLAGKKQVPLVREDSVVIYSKLLTREEFKVKISGEINNPGYFDYSDSLRIEDLILMAGGLRDAASLKRVEVSRRIKSPDVRLGDTATITATVVQFDINSDLNSTNGFVLEPFDEVIVRRSPLYTEQATVTINGEILYPGTYVVQSKRETISDLLKRAGGLIPEAYPEGAVLQRRTFVNSSDSALLENKLQVYFNNLRDSTDTHAVQSAMARKEQLVGINLNQIINYPGSKYDLFLEEGDIIRIPKKLQTVQLFGEVYFPKKVRYDKNIRFRDYIRGAGGFTSQALVKRSYVIYANGEVKSSRSFLFFNSFPKLKPGAEIYVPKKGSRKGMSTPEVLGITTGLASLALIIVTILDKSK